MSYRRKLAHERGAISTFEFCHVDDLDSLKEHWRALTAGEPGTFSLRFQSSIDACVRWVQLTCLPVCCDSLSVSTIIGCTTDVSAQKKVEENIKRAEAVKQVRIQEARLFQEAIEAKRQQERYATTILEATGL